MAMVGACERSVRRWRDSPLSGGQTGWGRGRGVEQLGGMPITKKEAGAGRVQMCDKIALFGGPQIPVFFGCCSAAPFAKKWGLDV